MVKRGAEFLPLFATAGAKYDIPPEYLYALAGRESSYNPLKVAGVSGTATETQARKKAVGLFQITLPVAKGYLREHPDSSMDPIELKLAAWKNPALNVEMGAWQLAEIRDAFDSVPGLGVDWRDANSVEMLTLGWNSGWGGLIRLVRAMKNAGITKFTIDTLQRFSRVTFDNRVPAKSTCKDIDDPAKRFACYAANRNTSWHRGVVADYFRALDFFRRAPTGV